ncbi:MAG: LytTR family DNA-binding domain-containing protein [Candidatus Izemoplasmatales bacterium]|nr:LytTR family DNA-binding domain-containing protein [Candidatus Izemoplasmatales bacterium]
MRIRVAIVEDDIESMEILEKYLRRYEKENNVLIDIFKYKDGDEIATYYESKYDIILLDIEMKRLDGMSTAKIIREFDKEVIIIFITNMPQYAIKGYEVKALSFLLKPVPYFAFSQEISDSISKIESHKERSLLLTTKDGVVKVNVLDIYYVETMKHYLIVHEKNGDHTIKLPLKKIEEELKQGSFFRCNNCFLVNLDEVKSVKDDYVVVSDTELKISRPRKKDFLEALAKHFGGNI